MEFYDGLDQPEQAKSTALFQGLADNGSSFRSLKFKAVTGTGLFEFKPTNQVRFIGDYRPGCRFALVVGTRKKQRKLDRGDIDQAKRFLKEFDDADGE